MKDLSNLQKRQDELEQGFKKLQTNMGTVIKDVNDLKGKMSEVCNYVDKRKEEDSNQNIEEQIKDLTKACLDDGPWLSNVRKEIEQEMNAVKIDMEEHLEIEKRKFNLIIHGIPEESEDRDKEEVAEILGSGLSMDPTRHIEMMMRLGKKIDGKIRPLRLRLKTLEGRREMLTRAKNLRHIERFKKLFITPDLTKRQQETDKILRMKLREFRDGGESSAKISYGKIIKNGPGGIEQVLFEISK